MSHNPLVTVIIPVYNAERFLSRCIDSVIHQTYSRIEIILVDNCSIDSSAEIIDSYMKRDHRIRNIKTEYNSGGPAIPRNRGLEIANGEYIAFLDSDDEWSRDKLAVQINMIKIYSCDVLFSKARMIDESGNKFGSVGRTLLFKFLKRFISDKRLVQVFNPVILSSCVFKNQPQIFFREDPKFHSVEDWAYWIERTHCGNKIHFDDKELLGYRIHGESLSNLNGELQYYRGLYLLTALLIEEKIQFRWYLLLSFLQILRIIKYRFFQ